ncbi:hydrolase 76 protein [Entophlyctis luteolus]|nr:hydrolase 76 protein [Entophlyctis luteolus]KAJ3391716.1 hydrolase 76 protein [Entophlyctis sp. JEL0112]
MNYQQLPSSEQESVGAWIESYNSTSRILRYLHVDIMDITQFYYAYYSYTGDSQYNDFVDGQMQLAVATNDGFLDAITALTGRWNDDIGWWALSVLTAAETTPNGILAPNNVMSGYNPTYLSIVVTTYNQMWSDWDSACNGGIYWARDRQAQAANVKYYKSSITNAQHMELSARLYALTGNTTYLTLANQVYNWMKATVIDATTYAVYDGIDTTSCSVSTLTYSYHSGELIAALSILYNATKDATYLTEAHKHWDHVNSYFTNNNVLYDANISKSPSGYLWAVYKGLADLYTMTTNSTVKSQIQTVMTASANANFQMCNSQWYCIRNLDPSTDFTLLNGTNVRDQFETVAILNSLAIITGGTTSTTRSQVVATTGATSAALDSRSGKVETPKPSAGAASSTQSRAEVRRSKNPNIPLDNENDDDDDDMDDVDEVARAVAPGKYKKNAQMRRGGKNEATLYDMDEEQTGKSVMKFYNIKSFDPSDWDPDALEMGTEIVAMLQGAQSTDLEKPEKGKLFAPGIGGTRARCNNPIQNQNMVPAKSVDASDPLGIKLSIFGYMLLSYRELTAVKQKYPSND